MFLKPPIWSLYKDKIFIQKKGEDTTVEDSREYKITCTDDDGMPTLLDFEGSTTFCYHQDGKIKDGFIS